nr:transposase family protein [Lachnoclostridium sp.]
MHSNCTRNRLDLKDVYIKKVVHADHYVKIFIETAPSLHICPDCGNQTKRIHDYRYQEEIKDLPFQMKHTYLVLKKKRYVCQCDKRFTEKYHFLPSYQQRTLILKKQAEQSVTV